MSDLITQLQSYGDQLEASVAPVEFEPGTKPTKTGRVAVVLAIAASILVIAFLAISALNGGDEGLEIITDEDSTVVDDTTETTVQDDPDPDPTPTTVVTTGSTEPTVPNVVPTFSDFRLSIDADGNLSILNDMIDPGGEQMDGVLTVFQDGVETGTIETLGQPVNQFALATLRFGLALEPVSTSTRQVALVLEADDGTEIVTLSQDWTMVDGTPFVAVMGNHGKAGDNILPRFASLAIRADGNVLSIAADVFDPDDEQLTAAVVLTENGEQIAADEGPSTPGLDGAESFAFEVTIPESAAPDRELVLDFAALSETGSVDFVLTWTNTATAPLTLDFSVDKSGN